MRSEQRTEFRVGLAASALAVIGLGLSIYLTVAHYGHSTVLACPDKGAVNCVKVTTSSYAVQHGVPLAVLGLGFFVASLALNLPPIWIRPIPLVRSARLAVAAAGAAAAVWLVWVELFRLDAICLYCTGVHIVAVALFAVAGIGTAATSPLS